MGTSAAQKKLFYNLKKIKSRLGVYENKDLAPQEVRTIASELVVDEEDVKEMNVRLRGDASLNTTIADEEEGSKEKIDFLIDKSQNIEENFAAVQELAYKKEIIKNCLLKLNEREQYIIKNRLLTGNPKTLNEIGDKFGFSRERARQIEEVALKKLKEFVLLAISTQNNVNKRKIEDAKK
jgi:RNA polymerase sigma-32 factor